jgi:hypothetical protein
MKRVRQTSENISSMSFGETVTPSLAMKRKPWVVAAERTRWAVSREGMEMSMTGMEDSAMVTGVW